MTYDKANEIIYSLDGTGRTTYLFDGAGNQARTTSPTLARTTYLWDGENRLSKVTLPTSVINTMTYNAASLRVQKQDSTGTTKSLWDGQNILLDANASNVTQALYSLNPNFFGNLLSQSRGGSSSFFQFDALGSAAALASSLGSLTDTYLYKAFGEAVDGSGTTVNPFRFVGRQGYVLDGDLANYYVRAREYDPGIARWLTRDPALLADNAFNRYRIVLNRSTFMIDPSGLFGVGLAFGCAAGAIGGIAGFSLQSFLCGLLGGCLGGVIFDLLADIGLPILGGCLGGALGAVVTSLCNSPTVNCLNECSLIDLCLGAVVGCFAGMVDFFGGADEAVAAAVAFVAAVILSIFGTACGVGRK